MTTMAKLKIARLAEEKAVKISLELPASVHRDLVSYAEILARQSGGKPVCDPKMLIAPMLARFMATDRAFARLRKQQQDSADGN